MSIAYVQSVKNSNGGGASVVSPSITPTTGNCLVAAIGWVGSNNIVNAFSDSLGNRWALVGTKNQNSSNTLLYACKVTTTGALTVSVGFTTSVPCDIIVAEYSGFAYQGGTCGSTNGAQGTNAVALPTFGSPANDLVVCAIYDQSHTSTFSYSGGAGTLATRSTTANPNAEALSLADMLSPGGVIGGQTATASGGSSTGLSVSLYDVSTFIGANALDGPEPLQNPQGQIVKLPKITGGSPPVPVAKNLAGCTIGIAYTETITVQSGTGPYTFAVSVGTLPSGLSLNSATGIISGTPTSGTAGTYNFTIQVTDSASNVGSQAFQIISAAPSSGGGSYVFIG